jgi:hypothetical protein
MSGDWRQLLPRVSDRRLAVRVTAAALREIRAGSPWVFDGSITSVGDAGAAGDLAVIFDDRRRFAAVGLWDPESPVRIKVLHAGAPVRIDGHWWRGTLHASLDRRASLAVDGATNAYRCVHGENDGLPALIVDRYDATLVVKLYSAALFPHLTTIVDELADLVGPERIVLRLARVVAAGDTFGLGDGETLLGQQPDRPVLFRERGLTMEADVVHGQKTGHYLDQRDTARSCVASLPGATCWTCSRAAEASRWRPQRVARAPCISSTSRHRRWPLPSATSPTTAVSERSVTARRVRRWVTRSTCWRRSIGARSMTPTGTTW